MDECRTDKEVTDKLQTLKGYKGHQGFTLDQAKANLAQNGFSVSDLADNTFERQISKMSFNNFKYYSKSIFNTHKTLNDVEELYTFDLSVKSRLQELLIRLEIYIKSISLETLMEASDYDPQFYLDESLYFFEQDQNDLLQKKLGVGEKKIASYFHSSERNEKVISFFDNVFEKLPKDSGEIRNDQSKHGGVSAWCLFNAMTLGEFTNFWAILNLRNKMLILDTINANIDDQDFFVHQQLFGNWLNSLRYVRNKVSHGSKIYNEILIFPAKIAKNDIEIFQLDTRKDEQKKLISVLLSMRRIYATMPKFDKQIWNDTISEIFSLSQKYSVVNLSKGLGIKVVKSQLQLKIC
ncbi:Abi family protein [Oenococcus sicerae]|uniref:Abi family protein n=1 Tax=Oenococcus sicerae TaxID=2203724 RepID=UPI0010B4B516|nr:hypothetical protein OAL24_00342 [Oenococcus sicerae]